MNWMNWTGSALRLLHLIFCVWWLVPPQHRSVSVSEWSSLESDVHVKQSQSIFFSLHEAWRSISFWFLAVITLSCIIRIIAVTQRLVYNFTCISVHLTVSILFLWLWENHLSWKPSCCINKVNFYHSRSDGPELMRHYSVVCFRSVVGLDDCAGPNIKVQDFIKSSRRKRRKADAKEVRMEGKVSRMQRDDENCFFF